jgi:hypothetical protein
MAEIVSPEICTIIEQFDIPGERISASPHGGGHINDTILSRFDQGGTERCYIHQRINRNVFHIPEQVMENVERVTRYAREQILLAGGDPERETLNLVPTRDGGSYFRTAQGEYWRTYHFISGARTYDIPTNLEMVYHAAYAFGSFLKLLARLPGSRLPGGRLHETIINFHQTRKRFETFVKILEADPVNRAASVRAEIDFILARERDASVAVDLLARGELPERVTHNDTKLNNVLIDDLTGRGICVIDLDTIMPGSTLYDFGDLIRMGTATAAEDEPDLAKVDVDLKLFEQLARGYLEAARDILTPAEWEHIVFGGRLITYEQAIRFLGDYINGDTYYKIHRPGQNLDRARTQIKMLAEMERKEEQMQRMVERFRY